MKGQMEETELTLSLLIQVIVIAVSIAAMMSVLTIWRPHRQISAANAQQLALAMDEVCASGNPREFDFKFPQPTPFTAGVLPSFIPGIFVNAFGDPYYLIYYEHFPPGEGVGWESLKKLPAKAFAYPAGPADEASLAQLTQEIKAKLGREDVTVIYPNVVLSEGDNLSGSVGRWVSDDYYAFEDFDKLPPAEKTSIKYRACGPDSLCFKTREGVQRLELPNCKGKIKGMQVNSPYMPSGLPDAFGFQERPNFYFASPCNARIKIELGPCECDEVQHPGAGRILAGITFLVSESVVQAFVPSWAGPATELIATLAAFGTIRPFTELYNETDVGFSYPIVTLGDTSQAKKRFSCANRLNAAELSGAQTEEACIIVNVESDDGYCVIPDKNPRLVASLVNFGEIKLAELQVKRVAKKLALNTFMKWLTRKTTAGVWGISKAILNPILDVFKVSGFGTVPALAGDVAIQLISYGILAGEVTIAIKYAQLVADQPIFQSSVYDKASETFIVDTESIRPGVIAPFKVLWTWP
jgi:hypothetical protein